MWCLNRTYVLQFPLWEGVVILNGLIFDNFSPWEGVVVSKELNFKLSSGWAYCSYTSVCAHVCLLHVYTHVITLFLWCHYTNMLSYIMTLYYIMISLCYNVVMLQVHYIMLMQLHCGLTWLWFAHLVTLWYDVITWFKHNYVSDLCSQKQNKSIARRQGFTRFLSWLLLVWGKCSSKLFCNTKWWISVVMPNNLIGLIII